MAYGVYSGVVVGGVGPGSWELEIEVDGDSWPEAAFSGVKMADDLGGSLFSLELDVVATQQMEKLHNQET